MIYPAYSKEIDQVELSQGFSLQRARHKEFVDAWVVYRGVNEDFAQSFTEMQAELAGVDCCFWFVRQERRVAGAILLPNRIGDFFLIPPEKDTRYILSTIMPLLEHWSDAQRPIRAEAIASHYAEAFHQVGFQRQERRVWMICPTNLQMNSWSSEWNITSLDSTDAPAIASLLHKAFADDVGHYGCRDFQAHLASVEDFLAGYVAESACGCASAIVAERESADLQGVCLVEMHKGLPTIRFVAVSPSVRRRGLAGSLLKRAIAKLALSHDWVKLTVTVGNPAIELYEKLGFTRGDSLFELAKPPSLPNG